MASSKPDQTNDRKKKSQRKSQLYRGFRHSQKNMTTPKGGGFSRLNKEMRTNIGKTLADVSNERNISQKEVIVDLIYEDDSRNKKFLGTDYPYR